MGKYKLYVVTLSKLFICIFLISTLSIHASATESCPKVNCDCESLPTESWKSTCKQQEKSLIQQCSMNNGEPTDYCFSHGPSGYPLPIAINLEPVSIIKHEKIDEMQKQVSTTFWSFHYDVEMFVERVDNEKFGEAQSILKTAGKNLELLFTKQREITTSLEVNEDEKGSIAAWEDYSEDTFEEAGKLYQIGLDLWDKRQIGDKPKLDQAYRVLSVKVLRLASKAYEMAAFSFDYSNQNKKAALAWKAASNTSKSLMKYKELQGVPSKHVSYYGKQAASRLLRASYHWQLSKKEKNANLALKASRELLKDRGSINGLLFEKDKPLEPKSEKVVAEY